MNSENGQENLQMRLGLKWGPSASCPLNFAFCFSMLCKAGQKKQSLPVPFVFPNLWFQNICICLHLVLGMAAVQFFPASSSCKCVTQLQNSSSTSHRAAVATQSLTLTQTSPKKLHKYWMHQYSLYFKNICVGEDLVHEVSTDKLKVQFSNLNISTLGYFTWL